MLTISITTCFFLAFLFLGNLLQFLNTQAYVIAPLFFAFLWCCSMFYHEANTKSLEGKDFLLSALFVLFVYFIYQILGFPVSKIFFTYYYLIVFICVELYADSIRFKSLI